MFSHVPTHAGNPLMRLTKRYESDPRSTKVYLGLGIYFDNEGKVPVLESVRTAAERVFAINAPTPYPPMEGDNTYRTLVGEFLFGRRFESLRDSLAIVQSVGGSGALKVGADFLKQHFPSSVVYVPDPTWGPHVGFFEGAGLTVGHYRYYNNRTQDLDFDGVTADLRALKPHDVVLLHPCCHNPTGVDPNREQWRQILDLIEKRNLIPFVDTAYPGFRFCGRDRERSIRGTRPCGTEDELPGQQFVFEGFLIIRRTMRCSDCALRRFRPNRQCSRTASIHDRPKLLLASGPRHSTHFNRVIRQYVAQSVGR